MALGSNVRRLSLQAQEGGGREGEGRERARLAVMYQAADGEGEGVLIRGCGCGAGAAVVRRTRRMEGGLEWGLRHRRRLQCLLLVVVEEGGLGRGEGEGIHPSWLACVCWMGCVGGWLSRLNSFAHRYA